MAVIELKAPIVLLVAAESKEKKRANGIKAGEIKVSSVNPSFPVVKTRA